MTDILGRFADMTPQRFAPGASLIEEMRESGRLFVLKSGTVEVRRKGTAVATITEPGAVLGEMSALLERPHTASVVAVTEVEAFGLDDGMAFLMTRPALAVHVAVLLAQRLDNTTRLMTRLKARTEQPRERTLIERVLGFLSDPPPRTPPSESQPRPR